MPKLDSPLDNVRVAAPCPADWNEMVGDERIRFCGQCQLNVYNLSAMTRREAESLLIEKEGKLCVSFFRRADGTIINENCPKGLLALKRRLNRTATAVFSSILSFLAGVGIYTAVHQETAVMGGMINEPIINKIDEVMHNEPLPILGEIAPVLNNKYVRVNGGLSAPDPVNINTSSTNKRQPKLVQIQKRRAVK